MKLVFAIDAGCLHGLTYCLRSLEALSFCPPVVVIAKTDEGADLTAFEVLKQFEALEIDLIPVEHLVSDQGLLHLMRHVPYFLKYAALNPDICDRVLFCDHDIAFMGEIKPLLEFDMQNAAIGAVLDQGFSLKGTTYKHNRQIGLNADAPYVNSGVLLCDTRVLASTDVLQQAAALYEANPDAYPFPDQCPLNVALQQHSAGSLLKILPPKWNWQTPAMRLAPDLLQPVHHFTGAKPWSISSWHHHPRCKALYGWPDVAYAIDGHDLGVKKQMSERLKRLVFDHSPTMKRRKRIFRETMDESS